MIKITYPTKIRKLTAEFDSRANTLGGISIHTLSEEERKGLVLFADELWPAIVVERGKKHELVYDSSGFVGLAIFTNGKTNARQYDEFSVRYVKLADTFIADYVLVNTRTI